MTGTKFLLSSWPTRVVILLNIFLKADYIFSVILKPSPCQGAVEQPPGQARVQVVGTPTTTQGPSCQSGSEGRLSHLVAQPGDNTQAAAPIPQASTICQPQLPASGRVTGKRKWDGLQWDYRANQQHWYFSKT